MGKILCLETARAGLRLATCAASILAEMAGGRAQSSRPGLVTVTLSDGTVVAEIKVRVVDINEEDARVRRELGLNPSLTTSGTRGQE